MAKKRIYCILTSMAMLFMMGSLPVKAEEVKAPEDFPVGEMKVSQETDKLILVVGQGGADISVSYHLKTEDGSWKTEFTAGGVCGRNGMSNDKKEGDGKTPVGVYQFNLAFGIQDDPGSILPYHKVTKNDYWVDDSSSRHYNKLVDAAKVKKDWKSAEKLINIQPYYDYGLSLTYNEDCVPGKGSAIFLHCTTPDYKGSSGCVCIPPENMVQLLKSVDEKTKIVIVPEISQLNNY